jgi:hypothetical protein
VAGFGRRAGGEEPLGDADGVAAGQPVVLRAVDRPVERALEVGVGRFGGIRSEREQPFDEVDRADPARVMEQGPPAASPRRRR